MNAITHYHINADRCGVPYEAAETLRRAALTLHGISEQECNGTLYRCEEPMNDHRGRPLKLDAVYQVTNINGPGPLHYYRTADRDTGARNRVNHLAVLLNATVEYQGDPRGWPFTLTMSDGRTLSVPPIRR